MNFRRILSKSSLRSSTSSAKSISQSEEVSKLHTEIELLKQTVESLKVSVENRDAAIGTLAREKEKLYVELKSVQRTNRNLQQQLGDERDMNFKEKEYLIEEIKRISKNDGYEINANQERQEESPNQSLIEQIKAKDEVIYNICAKYLKIKTSKRLQQKKLQKIKSQSQKMCENIILLLYENRCTLDNLLRSLIKTSSISPNSRRFLKLLKINANLHYENTQLKVCLSQRVIPDKILDVQSEKENVEDKWIHVKLAKSEGKLKDISYENTKNHLHYFLRLNKDPVNSSFKNIHGVFSPYCRRKIYRSKSAPCF